MFPKYPLPPSSSLANTPSSLIPGFVKEEVTTCPPLENYPFFDEIYLFLCLISYDLHNWESRDKVDPYWMRHLDKP